jgi:Zn-dependent protease with chaperone function
MKFKIIVPIVFAAFFSMSANAEFTLANSKTENISVVAKNATSDQDWCSPEIPLLVKSINGDALSMDGLARLTPKLGALFSSQCASVEKATLDIVDANGMTINNRVITKSTEWVLNIEEVSKPTKTVEDVKTQEVAPVESSPVADRVDLDTMPNSNKQQQATDTKPYSTPTEQLTTDSVPVPVKQNNAVSITQAKDNNTENQANTQSNTLDVATRQKYNTNDNQFIFLSLLSMVVFAGLIFGFIKSNISDKLSSARIALVATIIFSGLSTFYFWSDYSHVDPIIKLSIQTFFISVFLASLYALFSWITGLSFLTQGLKELTSLSNGDYGRIYTAFSEDVKSLLLDASKIKIYVDENSEVVNAFAYTNMMGSSCVVLNKPLIENLTFDEVRAVVVHELGHIRHQDSALMMLIMMVKNSIDRIVLFPVTITKVALSFLLIGAGAGLRSMNKAGMYVLLVFMTIAIFLLGYAAVLIVMFMLPGMILDVFFNIEAFKHSRVREFDADATAKELGLAESLSNALIRMHNLGGAVVLPDGQAKAFMGAPSNFSASSGINGSYSFASDSWISPTKWTKYFKPHLFSTHPEPQERIEKLKDTAKQENASEDHI